MLVARREARLVLELELHAPPPFFERSMFSRASSASAA
jgi:hypothetical protein